MHLVNQKQEILMFKCNHGIKMKPKLERGKQAMFKHKQAERLQMLRKKHGLTTRQLGAKLGVSNGIISRWCRGDAYPSRKHVRVICEYFNIEPAWLIYGIDDEPKESDFSFIYSNLSTENQERVLEIGKALLQTQVTPEIIKDKECGNGDKPK